MNKQKLNYNDVEVSELEDLNIDNHVATIITYCWYNVERFPLVDDISTKVGYTSRQIHNLVIKYRLPKRSLITSYSKIRNNEADKKA
jgi:hypothetical protein